MLLALPVVVHVVSITVNQCLRLWKLARSCRCGVQLTYAFPEERRGLLASYFSSPLSVLTSRLAVVVVACPAGVDGVVDVVPNRTAFSWRRRLNAATVTSQLRRSPTTFVPGGLSVSIKSKISLSCVPWRWRIGGKLGISDGGGAGDGECGVELFVLLSFSLRCSEVPWFSLLLLF